MTAQEIIASDGYFRCNDWSDGIAWYCVGPELEDDADTEWTGYQVETGRVLMVMVGDDRKFPTDPEDVQPIADDAFCRDCGQIGCRHNVYE
jgi:hypothetical protein